MPDKTRRNRQLSQIHIAKTQLGLDDETYRAMLHTIARVRSSSDLDEHGRAQVLDHLKARGFKPKRKGRSKPADSRELLVRKIRAQLGDRPESYADGIARHMFGVERFEWCEPKQLQKIVQALAVDAKRKGRPQYE